MANFSIEQITLISLEIILSFIITKLLILIKNKFKEYTNTTLTKLDFFDMRLTK